MACEVARSGAIKHELMVLIIECLNRRYGRFCALYEVCSKMAQKKPGIRFVPDLTVEEIKVLKKMKVNKHGVQR